MPFDVVDRILRPLRRGPATSRYPNDPPDLPAAARGLPDLDPTRCNGSGACVASCPTAAIHLSGSTWTLDAGACLFCGACARACPRDALRLSMRIELAVHDRRRLLIERPWGKAP
jgi:formate hydrogenlyase subunit 6/NADH:ubiquinone oxidoreductase subunit I